MTIIRALAVALALAAIAVPTAQAKPVDVQFPAYPTPVTPSENGPKDYSMNSATGDYRAPATKQDRHTTDMVAAAAATGWKDLRMPDTVDAANGRGPATAPDITVVRVPTPAPVAAPSSGGVDWADAGIGAGGALAMIVLAGGSALAVVHRRRTLRPVA
jgi:hypothetical protein